MPPPLPPPEATSLSEEASVELVRLRRQNALLETRLREATAARATAEQTGADKSRLLAFATHDLKSPLSSLHTTCGFVIESAEDPGEVRALARLMQAEIGRMTRLVHDFLDRSALDAGALRIDPLRISLADVARQVAADLDLAARLKEQTIRFDPAPENLPAVHGDPARLGQILANLVDNAVKYTPTRGLITITLGHDAQGVWCAVQDTGPGLTPSDMERLFRPYERLSARPGRGESSHGLGLALAQELTALHHGTLVAASPAKGGARFTLTLPPAA